VGVKKAVMTPNTVRSVILQGGDRIKVSATKKSGQRGGAREDEKPVVNSKKL